MEVAEVPPEVGANKEVADIGSKGEWFGNEPLPLVFLGGSDSPGARSSWMEG